MTMLFLTRVPCVLVSPDSVARFFPAAAAQFDLVVFDEASQIRVADESDPEHDVALALEPIRALVDRPHARHLERAVLRELYLHAQEAAIRQ